MMIKTQIELTAEQFVALKPLFDALIEATKGEQRGLIIGQCGISGTTLDQISFWFIEPPYSQRIVEACHSVRDEVQRA